MHGCQSPLTGRSQLSDATGRIIKPGTYFDAGPELTIEKHRCIGTAILQDPTNRQSEINTLHRDIMHSKTMISPTMVMIIIYSFQKN